MLVPLDHGKNVGMRQATVTRNRRVLKTSGLVVAALDVIAPADAGKLWETLKSSHTVGKNTARK